MAECGIYDTVKQAIQDVVAPQLRELKGEIAGLSGETRQIEKRREEGCASLRTEMNVRFTAFDEKFTQRINALDEKFTQRLDSTNKRLDDALEIRERLAAVEAKLSAQLNRN
ncbi:MAG: hypothetical protein ACREQ4_17380 [Candidatus Binataceae bacterium]